MEALKSQVRKLSAEAKVTNAKLEKHIEESAAEAAVTTAKLEKEIEESAAEAAHDKHRGIESIDYA